MSESPADRRPPPPTAPGPAARPTHENERGSEPPTDPQPPTEAMPPTLGTQPRPEVTAAVPTETDPTEARTRQPKGKQAHEGSAETTVTPGSRALAAAYQLLREGKRVSVKAAAKLAKVDRSHLIKKYPEVVAAIKQLATPDQASLRGKKDGRTGSIEAWVDE